MNKLTITVKKVFSLFQIKIKDLIKFIFPNLLIIFFEIAGLALIPIFFSIIIGSDLINFPLIKFIFQDTSKNKLLLIIGISFVIIFIIKNLLVIFLKSIITKITLKYLNNLRVKLLESYQNMEYSNFIQKEKMAYVRNLTEHTYRSHICLEEIFRLFSEFILLGAIIIYLIILNPIITISFIVLLFLLVIFYIYIIKAKVVNFGYKRNLSNQIIYQNIYENFSGFKEINLLNKHLHKLL